MRLVVSIGRQQQAARHAHCVMLRFSNSRIPVLVFLKRLDTNRNTPCQGPDIAQHPAGVRLLCRKRRRCSRLTYLANYGWFSSAEEFMCLLDMENNIHESPIGTYDAFYFSCLLSNCLPQGRTCGETCRASSEPSLHEQSLVPQWASKPSWRYTKTPRLSTLGLWINF